MARIFVTSDDQRVRVEITWMDETGGWFALCKECNESLVAGTHEQFSLEDTVQAAEIHADSHTERATS